MLHLVTILIGARWSCLIGSAVGSRTSSSTTNRTHLSFVGLSDPNPTSLLIARSPTVDMNTYCERDRHAWKYPLPCFTGFLLASFMQADYIHHGLLSVWRMLCNVVVKKSQQQQPVMWKDKKFGGEEDFEEMGGTVMWEDVKTEWMPNWGDNSILSGVDLATILCRDAPGNNWFKFLCEICFFEIGAGGTAQLIVMGPSTSSTTSTTFH